ncbi:MAG: P-loop NTPase, partial [Bacteroidales bacterium]|nr:P-loop NTPase [Bacteroidales bacterium]
GLFDADLYGPSLPVLFNLLNERPDAHEENGKTMIEPFTRLGIKLMSLGFFIDPKQAVLWRGPLASNTLKQLVNDTNWGTLDYLVIDTPPGTGDIHITLLQQYEVSGVIVVTTPQNIALSDVEKTISMYHDSNIGAPVLGIVENMSWFSPSKHPDEKYFLFGQGGGKTLAEKFNVPLLAQIPMDENICNSCDDGKLDELFTNPGVKSGFNALLKTITGKKGE